MPMAALDSAEECRSYEYETERYYSYHRVSDL